MGIISLALVAAINLANSFVGTPDSLITAPGVLPSSKSVIQMENDNQLEIKNITITAYSSTYDQTDSDPFVTSSGTKVHEGVMAANFLPFGTKVKIPSLFGDKVFTVEDRMAKRHSDRVDVWFPTRTSASEFGLRNADLVIVN